MRVLKPLQKAILAAFPLFSVGMVPNAAAQSPDDPGNANQMDHRYSEQQEYADGGQCPPYRAARHVLHTAFNGVAIQFELVDPLPATIPPGAITPFVIRIVGVSESVVVDSARLHYRKGLGAFITTPLTPSGVDLYSVPLPAAPCGATFDYYLSAEGNGGTVVREPLGAPTSTYTVRAIVEEERFFDDFETDFQWTTLPPDALNGDGAWTRVVPIGTTTGGLAHIQAQPDADHTPDPGEWCYVTGQPNLPGDPEGRTDVDGGPVDLVSPVIPLDAPDALIRYARWFFSSSDVNHPEYDDELTVDISRDAGANWVTVETVASTGAWVMHSFRLSDFSESVGNQLQVRFSTVDEPNNSLTEVAIDDVEVRAIFCTSGPGDYDGNGSIEPADFGFLANCLTGPVASLLDDWCATFDFDEDADVDLDDWRMFQFRFAPTAR